MDDIPNDVLIDELCKRFGVDSVIEEIQNYLLKQKEVEFKNEIEENWKNLKLKISDKLRISIQIINSQFNTIYSNEEIVTNLGEVKEEINICFSKDDFHNRIQKVYCQSGLIFEVICRVGNRSSNDFSGYGIFKCNCECCNNESLCHHCICKDWKTETVVEIL